MEEIFLNSQIKWYKLFVDLNFFVANINSNSNSKNSIPIPIPIQKNFNSNSIIFSNKQFQFQFRNCPSIPMTPCLAKDVNVFTYISQYPWILCKDPQNPAKKCKFSISRRAVGPGMGDVATPPSVTFSFSLKMYFNMYFLETLQVCAPCHGGVLYSF